MDCERWRRTRHGDFRDRSWTFEVRRGGLLGGQGEDNCGEGDKTRRGFEIGRGAGRGCGRRERVEIGLKLRG